jgi:hypothetical protein
MKTKILCFIVLPLLLVFSQCAPYPREKYTPNFGSEKQGWKNNFKTEFFLKCLQKGIKNDTLTKVLTSKDLLYYNANPLEFQHHWADSLATAIIQNQPVPIFPNCDDCEESKEVKKRFICGNCLNYYASRELDSIAEVAYKKHLANDK